MPITGDVLRWACDAAGLSPREVAAALDVTPGVVNQWMFEKTEPNLGQVRKIAKLVGRPPSFFFLPKPPKIIEHNVSFRTYAGYEGDRIPPETYDALELAKRIQRTAAWVHERTEDDAVIRVPRADAQKDDPEKVGAKLRVWLSWPLSAQTAAVSTDASASRQLRTALEAQGLLVLALSLDEDVTRGFSLAHANAPLICVNTRDHHRARLFSYAHELAHLTLDDPAVCLTRSNRGIERFCNRVAAALLMPERQFRDYVKKRIGGQLRTTAHVTTVRNHFRVSLLAAAIRADALGLAGTGLVEAVIRETEQKGRGGSYQPGNERTRPRVRVDQYGQSFVTTILQAEDEGVLRRGQVLELLRISDAELGTVRELARAGAGE